MTRRYQDFNDDPLYDPEDEIYGDYEEELGDGFSIYQFDSPEDLEEDE